MAILVPCKDDRVEAFLESQLTKTDRPGESSSAQGIGEGHEIS
jgi:hypothetical protein